MKRLLAIFAFCSLSVSCLLAAPLEGGSEQARDAVQLLQSWGLQEGYPDGHFRGYRAVSRYEAAMLLARSLERLHSQQVPLLSAEQLRALSKLQSELTPELEALGARVDSLDRDIQQLEKRVEEAERILFSGRWVSRYVGQSFSHNGAGVSGPGGVDYNRMVGSVAGTNFLPHGSLGILPVLDYSSGRPLTNGTGFTSTLFLDINFLLDQEWDGDLTLFAHSSQGDAVIDALWGTNPGYLAHPFTGSLSAGDSQGQSRTPFTTAGFQSLEVRNQSGLTITLGHYEPALLNPAVFLTPVNPNVKGPALLGCFGFRVLADLDPVAIEVLGSKLPDGSPDQGGPKYDTNVLGATAQYRKDHLTITANALRVANESSGGLPLAVGQVGAFNGRAGEFYANWVNPEGYWVNQLGGPGDPGVAGVNSLSDKRPVPGFAATDDFGALATIGPQSQTSAGLSVNWEHDTWGLLGDYAFSNYRPNKNSRYSSNGSLWRLGGHVRLLDESLKLAAQYRYTDPDYDPFVLSFPTTVTGTNVFRAYHRLPSFNQFWHLYSLHNSEQFPVNRQGLWLEAGWRYDPDGFFGVKYRNLNQVKTSLQDVRFTAGALGPGTPNTTVLGHSPGFMDPVFRSYSPLSFDANLNPLEDNRGKVESFGLELEHIFTGSPWRVDLNYEQWRFRRPSALPASLGGSQNRVDLKTSLGKISVGRTLGQDFLLTLGYQRAGFSGHYDPAGVYNPFAIANSNTDFKNRDTVQHIPFARADWQVAENTRLQTEVRHFSTHDRVSSSIGAGALNGPNSTAHPFSWDGIQVMTTVEVEF